MTEPPINLTWTRLERLLQPIHESAQSTCRRLCRNNEEGDDLFQESVLRAYDRLSSLREESSFRSWFFVILLRIHRDRSRRSFWQRFLPLEEVPAPPAVPGGGDFEEDYLRAKRLRLALGQLPTEQREALVLFEMEGFSVSEIADLQSVSPSAIKSRLSRGRSRMRDCYERWNLIDVKQADSSNTKDREHGHS